MSPRIFTLSTQWQMTFSDLAVPASVESGIFTMCRGVKAIRRMFGKPYRADARKKEPGNGRR